MKQFRTYIAVLCALLLAVGCSKQMDTEVTKPTDAISIIKIGDFPAFDDGAQTRAIGTPDPGKTEWAKNDTIYLALQFKNKEGVNFGSKQFFTLTYDGAKWASDKPLDKISKPDYRATVIDIEACYAPDYEFVYESGYKLQLKAGKVSGLNEYLTYTAIDRPLADGISIDFSGARPYSRLRVATEVGATVAFTPSNGTFTPAGSESALADATTLTATTDAKGNAFFFGTWTASEFNFTTTKGDKSFELKKSITAVSESGKSYAINATQPFMITINTSKNTDDPSDATFILPIKDTTISGYDLTVDWGDGKSNTYVDGTVLNEANMTHTYPQAGEYTISISSSQTDATQQQMPKLNFYNNYSGTNNNALKLISVNSPLLNMGGESFYYVFSNCSNLTEIPAGLFDQNTQVTDFSYCFNNCVSLTTIPAGLFDQNTKVTYFDGCFYDCSNLTEIPAGLFDNNTQATNFNYCFNSCRSLTKIPAGLFDQNTQVTNFNYCFNSCRSLTKIPAGLFDQNTLVTNFNYCFNNCESLTEIPAGLFDNNIEVTDFAGCFGGCTSLTEIPAGLFEKNTKVTDFAGCFNNCRSLTEIPAGLFAKNIEATQFFNSFSGCTKAVLNPNIFCNEATEKETRFAGKRVNFRECFYNCGTDASVTNGGTAPALWEYTMDARSTKTRCFTDVTNVTNAAAIPADWK